MSETSIIPYPGCSWFIERRVTGTQQVSTVGHLPADPPTLSFLDSSSALSPWTSYQYRLVLHNQAGNTTGKAIWMVLKFSQNVCMLNLTQNHLNSPLSFKVKVECLHIFCICRTLGYYHHQTLSTSRSQSTKGEGLGGKFSSGMGAMF